NYTRRDAGMHGRGDKDEGGRVKDEVRAVCLHFILHPFHSAAPAQVRGGEEARRASVFGRLLVGVGEADELRLGEGAAVEAYADGQAVDVAGGHLNVRVAGDGRGRGTAAGEVVAVQKVCRPGGAACGSDDGVEVVFRHQGVQPLRLRERLA